MAVFVVFALSKPDAVKQAAAALYPNDHLETNSNEILISANATAREVSDTLGISEAENGSGIVFKMSSYFGRYSVSVWDWIKTKVEHPNG